MSDVHPPGHYYGGQAVVEGVMMRGARVWAVAVRRPSGDIYLERHALSDFPERHPAFRKPMLRGVYALVDALTIGTRALSISAANSMDEEEEQLSSTAVGGSLLAALVLFIGIFVVAPNVGLSFFRGVIGDGWLYHLLEGVLRIVIFLAYLLLISLFGDIRRVFAYHGGEHKTIAAWEHGEVLEPTTIQRYSTLHVRCGTNFLIMVMLIALVVYSVAGFLVPAPDGGALAAVAYHVALRVVLLPVVAGLAYEGLRLGAARDNLLVRAITRPGIWLQLITTRPPTDDQVEVAIRAFEAVVPTSDMAGATDATGTGGRSGRDDGVLTSPVVWGPDEAPEGIYLTGPTDVTGAVVERDRTGHAGPVEPPDAGGSGSRSDEPRGSGAQT